MELPEDVIAEVRRRLRRARGQIEGVERMLDEGRDCKEIVAQITAATRALEQAGLRLVAAGLIWCLAHPEEAEASGYPLATVEKMLMRLG